MTVNDPMWRLDNARDNAIFSVGRNGTCRRRCATQSQRDRKTMQEMETGNVSADTVVWKIMRMIVKM
jgi:hypothetical protein